MWASEENGAHKACRQKQGRKRSDPCFLPKRRRVVSTTNTALPPYKSNALPAGINGREGITIQNQKGKRRSAIFFLLARNEPTERKKQDFHIQTSTTIINTVEQAFTTIISTVELSRPQIKPFNFTLLAIFHLTFFCFLFFITPLVFHYSINLYSLVISFI